MKKNQHSTRETVLEVRKDGYRRTVYRTATADGSTIYLEESDLVDFSRPIQETNDLNVFFTERSFWKSFTEYMSCEGLMKRQAWHESANEWLGLSPVFIHSDIRHLVQQSLAEVTRGISSEDHEQIEGIRVWLRGLAQPADSIEWEIANTCKIYRHAV